MSTTTSETAATDAVAAPPADPAPRRAGRSRRFVRGREDDPRWVRPTYLLLLTATAVTYLWNLGASGYANSFYAAAVQAGTQSPKAWLFGALDAPGLITVDKPPAALWVMALSGRIFGFSSWSMLAPQALMGVASVALVYATVRRWSGPRTALAAAAMLAFTPAAVLMFRFNNPDALLVLCMIAATYVTTRAVDAAGRRAGTWWLVAAGALVGAGFLTKQLQVTLVVPGLALVYLLVAPTTLRRRVLDLLAAGVAIVVSAGWYVLLVELWPASSRPYVGGSTDNSLLELALGYNGLGRILGGEGNGGGGGGPRAAGIGVVVAGFGAAYTTRLTLRPLHRVSAIARRVSELPLETGDVELAERVPDADADPRSEVGQVGVALNRMLGHVGAALEARQDSETRLRRFVADASHELRTPLAAIRGYSELAARRSDEMPPEVAGLLERVGSQTGRMTALVEDLLLLARLDAGRPLARERVDLARIVVDAVTDAHLAAPDRQWSLGLPDPAEDDADLDVVGDPERLHQVVSNLLANARTHTPPGTTVTTRLVRGDGLVCLEVADDGPGIPPDLLPHVFERFARGETGRARTSGSSTGLGLSIVSAVVTEHGGSLDVASRPGDTRFRVALPVAPGQGPPSVDERAALP